MVKVVYAPPPYGPRSSLNRPGYGHTSNSAVIRKLSTMKQTPVIIGAVGLAMGICALPQLLLEEIPETCQPEYQAASRAYMRYHNMNPIWGISAKKVRGLDDH